MYGVMDINPPKWRARQIYPSNIRGQKNRNIRAFCEERGKRK